MQPETGQELRAGMIAVMPVVAAVIPFGLLLGALAAQKGLSPVEVMVMSALVFAGASQFVAVDIWTDPAPWVLLTFTALLVNSRHVLMGASLTPGIAHLSGRQSLLVLFLMTDEVWALAEARARRVGLSFAFYLGMGGVLWVGWVACTGLGATVGMVVADPSVYGFDFAFTAIFIGLLAGVWRGAATGGAICVSAGVATLVYLTVDGPWYIAAGGIAGALTAAAMSGPSEAAGPEVTE
jgi:4-azaleucine resistance transporter AzlC